jgi:phage terminase large subunit
VKKIKIEHGECFEKIKEAYDSGQKVIINKGGTGSGKTFDNTIFIISLCYLLPNKVFTVVSESVPHLDIGVVRIFDSVMKSAELYDPDCWQGTYRKYTFANGSILEFFSADRIGKALGARRFLLYGNEINNLKFEIFDELSRRSEVILADFNPTAEFWLEKFMTFYGGIVIKSNYLSNPFLPDHEKERILRRASMDENFKRIHIDAEYGNYEGVVFKDWKQSVIPDEANLIGYGFDFGYTNDPSALVAIFKYQSEHYFKELIYKTGLLSGDMVKLMNQLIVNKTKPIYADSSDPRLIQEIKNAGYNIEGIKKEKVETTVEFCKSFLNFVDLNSINMIRELRSYSYIKKDGVFTNVPCDLNNHCIDALRYGLMGLYKPHGDYQPAQFSFL